jgi:hypothetical protein
MFSLASYKSRPINFETVGGFWLFFVLSLNYLATRLLDEIDFLMHNSVGHVSVHILQLDKAEFSTLNL